MDHNQFMRAMIKLNETLCKLRLLGVDLSTPQGGDDGLESILAPDTTSQGLVYWKGRLVDARNVLETNPSHEAIIEYSKARVCVQKCEVNAGMNL